MSLTTTSLMPQILQFVKNHYALSLIFAAALGAVVFEEFRQKFKPSTFLSTQDAINLINHHSAMIVDVRDNALFKNGHIANAINASKADLEKICQRLAGHKEKPILFVATTDQEAQKIIKHLKMHGFSKLYILANGISAWQTANLPLVKS